MKFNKGSRENIATYLTCKEFQCKCRYENCTTSEITEDNARSFTFTRMDFDYPIGVTSGYRCEVHNLDVGGVKDSKHRLGDAIDLVPLNGNFDRLEVVARKYYKFVLRYEKFIHCDNRAIL